MIERDDYNERLRNARGKIDQIDGEIIALLRDRLRVSAEIGQLRKNHGLLAVGDRDRGSEVLARYRSACITTAGTGRSSLEAIGLAILEQSAALQRQIIRDGN